MFERAVSGAVIGSLLGINGLSMGLVVFLACLPNVSCSPVPVILSSSLYFHLYFTMSNFSFFFLSRKIYPDIDHRTRGSLFFLSYFITLRMFTN